MKTGNLYEGISAELPIEIAETLMVSKGIRIERIVSKGHRSEPDFWYDDEWVLLVKAKRPFGWLCFIERRHAICCRPL